MRVALRISQIDQEHLQELYNAAAVARDVLPYTQAFEQLWHDFEDRTFKKAHREQLFGALIKHVRSGAVPSQTLPPTMLDQDQLRQLGSLSRRHQRDQRLSAPMPYSDEFAACRVEFCRAAGVDLGERDFWLALLHARVASRAKAPRSADAALAVGASQDRPI